MPPPMFVTVSAGVAAFTGGRANVALAPIWPIGGAIVTLAPGTKVMGELGEFVMVGLPRV